MVWNCTTGVSYRMPFRGTYRGRVAPNIVWTFVLAIGFVLFVVDLYLPLGTGKGVLYALVVLLSQNLKHRRGPLIVASYCTLLMIAGTLFGTPHPEIPAWLWVPSRIFGFVVIWGSFWFTKV